MIAKVRTVSSDTIIRLDRRWTFHGLKGSMVKIAGLLPARPDERDAAKEQLQTLLLNKEITLEEFLFLNGNVLSAIITYAGRPLPSYFQGREIPTLEPSRWHDPEENRAIERVFGGLPKAWDNPINDLPMEGSPFWGNLAYPLKFWERDYDSATRLVSALYTDSHQNKRELDRWFKVFLTNPHREAALLVKGEVGVGKSWWIGHKLASLPRDKYHVILIDLRYKRRGSELAESIEATISEHLEHYITDLSWLYPDFRSIYGTSFDPEDAEIRRQMIDRALSLSTRDLNEKRLRYYGFEESPQLIVAFDNIDHFDEVEIITTLDVCRRMIGDKGGIKVMVALRPTTRLPKSRRGVVFGDMIHRPIELKSPNLYEVLRRRMATNHLGKELDSTKKLKGTSFSLRDVLDKFRHSDTTFGLARLMKALCCTERVGEQVEATRFGHDAAASASTYDMRFYIKLFRRLLRSNTLASFENIGTPYYGIHALLLHADEPLAEGDAYLFNLFDHEKPDMRGNALVRYRVLEYCSLFHDAGELFDVYFSALGIGKELARSVLHLFEDAGLVDLEFTEIPGGDRLAVTASISIPGRRHLEMTTNLWYVICVKTGMNIYRESILFGKEARRQAQEFVRSEKILAFYSDHGWVSEGKFVEFLGHQLYLEERRIGRFQEQHPEWRDQIANMVAQRTDPAGNIHWAIHEQLAAWRHARTREWR